eukprot:COSAG02_NODE_1555_length_11948_cov_28.444932_7_plen_294_part_00
MTMVLYIVVILPLLALVARAPSDPSASMQRAPARPRRRGRGADARATARARRAPAWVRMHAGMTHAAQGRRLENFRCSLRNLKLKRQCRHVAAAVRSATHVHAGWRLRTHADRLANDAGTKPAGASVSTVSRLLAMRRQICAQKAARVPAPFAVLLMYCMVLVHGSLLPEHDVFGYSTLVRKNAWRTSTDGCTGPSCRAVFSIAHKTDDDDDDGAPQVTSTVEGDLETLIQEALEVYHKIQKLDVMGGEEGLRKRILSYGAGLAPDDPQRVSRAQEFLELVKRRFAKRLKNEL